MNSALLIDFDALEQKRFCLLFEPIWVAGVKLAVDGDNPMPRHIDQFGRLDVREDMPDMARHEILCCCNGIVRRYEA